MMAPLGEGPGVAIAWTKGARYRLGKLPQPPTFADLARGSNPNRSLSSLCDFVWAAQVEQPPVYASPQDVAEAMDESNIVGLASAFADAVTASNPPPEGKAKGRTVRKRLRASSSA